MKHFIALFIFMTVPTVGWGKAENASISNYFKTISQVDSSNWEVFAGNTSTACASTDGINPCDSCLTLASTQIFGFSASSTSKGLVCNNGQIYPSLLFTVSMRSTKAEHYASGRSGDLIIGKTGDKVIAPVEMSTYTPNQANQQVTASFSWADICRVLNDDATCTKSFADDLQFGFSSDGDDIVSEGIGAKVKFVFRYVKLGPPVPFGCTDDNPYSGFCSYKVFPGDEKVFVLEPLAGSTSLVAGDHNPSGVEDLSTGWKPSAEDPSRMKISAVRLYFGEYPGGSSWPSLTPVSDFREIGMQTGENGFSDTRIRDLVNGVSYSILSANVDQAGNVFNFIDPNPSPSYPSTLSMDPSPGTGATIGTTQGATPEPVVGLLDDQKCFIATAAFGNADDAQVRVLRKFRNEFLLTTNLGKSMVNFYYQNSPPIAQVIAGNEALRFFVRTLLWPIVGFAWVLNTFGFLATLVSFGSLMGVSFIARKRWVNQ